ncbi:hypothetical protein MNBD_NITROSPINAE05-799 [hydrothermal vent metagenome]|uniref:Uncharacterized protein n=1 Tax=hydrothermal vent metagenome TaxID=652676 RepID=A0A3B1CU85_9ZZZZ
MTVEVFRAVTPYLTFFLAVLIAIIAWFLKWMASGTRAELRDIKKNIDSLESEIRGLEKDRRVDQKYNFEQYVDKESFYLAVGKTEGLISRIFDQLNELGQSVHEIIGAVNAKNSEKIE